jgi:hypothetical protein
LKFALIGSQVPDKIPGDKNCGAGCNPVGFVTGLRNESGLNSAFPLEFKGAVSRYDILKGF